MGQSNVVFGMPPLPTKIKEGSGMAENWNKMVDYVTWLGKHFRKEDNFICQTCGKTYSPAKVFCPECHPSGPTTKR